MRSTFEFRKPDDLEASITITATVKEFRELRQQLTTAFPSWQLGSQISEVIRAAEERFYATEEAA